jgi:protein FRA10AC1
MSGGLRKNLKNVVSAADHALLEEKYEFLPSDKKPTSWQDRMVERYHDGLYKEFALADLSRPGKLGLRWRTRQEVVEGRGERTCGNKKCQVAEDLIALEVPFSYVEDGVSKKEMVKLRLCPLCKPLVETKSSRKQQSPSSDAQRSRNVDSGHDDSPEHNNSPSSRNSSSSSDSDSSEENRLSRKKKRRRNDICNNTSDDSDANRPKTRREERRKSETRSHSIRKEY